MGRIFFYLMVALFLFSGCGLNTEVVDSVEDKLKNNDEIAKYVDSIDIKHRSNGSHEGYSFIDFSVYASANDDFLSLSDKEKYDILSKVDNILSEGAEISYQFECGKKKICTFEDIIFENGQDTYSFNTLEWSDELVMNHNGERAYPTVSETVTTTPDDDDSEFDNTIVNKEAVYNFMENKYKEITNNGENYVPETHDPLVAQLASKRFGISAEEAGQIYVEVSLGQ
ncbi:hypothetical protein [Halobacillus naozhouensis]|uniref:Lipoprotein n=1 Tax=Halobacillus naozhouensis TaxID=554880 RepID=A0ABY8J2Y5_9BACI|nr:hypothetical protein [Halobacillus naozhouensis]WFT75942.1 hypothetical protein P9989_06130 [Halobacillus naozhouensis]